MSGGCLAIPASMYRLSVFVDFRQPVVSVGRCQSASGLAFLNVPIQPVIQGMRSLQLSI